MKNLFILAAFIAFSAVSFAQPSFVTAGTCGTGGASCTLSPNLTVQTGDMILVEVTTSSCPGSNTLTVTDGTNTYTQITGSPWTGTGSNDCVIIGIFKTLAAGSTSYTVVCHDTNSSGYLGCSAAVYRQSSIAIDQIAYAEAYHFQNCASGQPACTPATGTSGTTGNTNETLVAFYGSWASNSGTWTVGSGWTQREQITGSPIPLEYIEDKTVSSKGTYAGTVTQVITGSSPQQASTDGIIVTLGSPPFNPSSAIRHKVTSQ